MKCKVQQENANIGWESALEDAKRKHAEGRKYVAKMRSIIRMIQKKVALGEEFPGTSSSKTRKLS